MIRASASGGSQAAPPQAGAAAASAAGARSANGCATGRGARTARTTGRDVFRRIEFGRPGSGDGGDPARAVPHGMRVGSGV